MEKNDQENIRTIVQRMKQSSLQVTQFSIYIFLLREKFSGDRVLLGDSKTKSEPSIIL